jgi:hypothetical protein
MKLSFSWDMSEMPAPVGGDYLLPRTFSARFEGPEDHTLVLDLVVEDDTPICQAIHLLRNPQRPSLTAADLKRIGLANLIAWAAAGAAMMRRPVGWTDPNAGRALPRRPARPRPDEHSAAGVALILEGGMTITPPAGDPGSAVTVSPPTADEHAAVWDDVHRRQRRNVITDAMLQEVARIYRANLEDTGTPTDAVKDSFHVSTSTAGRYVSLARQRGFLGPTTPGKAGEEAR